MDINQCTEFFTNHYAGKKIEFTFDEKCHKAVLFQFTDGLPHAAHQIECDKVKVTVEGMEPFYVPVNGHRSVAGFEFLKKNINDKNDFVLTERELAVLLKSKSEKTESFDAQVKQLSDSVGMPCELVHKKINEAEEKSKESA